MKSRKYNCFPCKNIIENSARLHTHRLLYPSTTHTKKNFVLPSFLPSFLPFFFSFYLLSLFLSLLCINRTNNPPPQLRTALSLSGIFICFLTYNHMPRLLLNLTIITYNSLGMPEKLIFNISLKFQTISLSYYHFLSYNPP